MSGSFLVPPDRSDPEADRREAAQAMEGLSPEEKANMLDAAKAIVSASSDVNRPGGLADQVAARAASTGRDRGTPGKV